MTSSTKYSFGGHHVSQMGQVRRKEIQLHQLNLVGHREVRTQLMHIQEWVKLTPIQAKALNDELAWRKREIKRVKAHIKALQMSAARWDDKTKSFKKRSV